MKSRNIFSHKSVIAAASFVALTALSGCYKEDAQELYQRQYVTSVALADLQQQADQVNRQVSDINTAVANLHHREPISKLLYDVQSNDTLGAFMTLGTKTIYVPFGRDGRDGRNGADGKDGRDGRDGKDGATPAFEVTIGADGLWYINGRNTGRPAQGAQGIQGEKGETGQAGKDGCTPTFSAAQDADNSSDTRFYWTVTWCDGKSEFILANGQKIQAQARDGKDGRNGADGKDGHDGLNGKDGRDGKDGKDGKDGATGPQGPKGEDGRPGVISPITEIAYNAKGDSVVIKTTYPHLPVVKIPLHPDRMFDIQPENALQGTTARGSRFEPTTRVLSFEPGETLTFPYTKSERLERVFVNSLPEGWGVRIDAQNIHITAPSMASIEAAPHYNQLTFSARDKHGQAYQRDLVVKLDKRIYINYFFNPSHRVTTQSPTSTQNVLNLPTNLNLQHEFTLYLLTPNGTYQRVVNFTDQGASGVTGAQLNAHLRQPYVYGLPKEDALDFQTLMFKDFVFDPATMVTAYTNAQRTAESHILRVEQVNDSPLGEAYNIAPIAWDTYGAETIIGSNAGVAKLNQNRSVVTTIRLKRLAQRTTLYMKNPRQWLGIPAGEAIDVSKMSASIPSALGMTAAGDAWLNRAGTKAIVTKTTGTGITYDAANDLLTVTFCHFPTQETSSYRMLLEYPLASGTMVRKVVTHGGILNVQQAMILAGNGGEVEFRVGVPLQTNNGVYASSVWTKPENGQGTITNLNPAVGVRDLNPAYDDF